MKISQIAPGAKPGLKERVARLFRWPGPVTGICRCCGTAVAADKDECSECYIARQW